MDRTLRSSTAGLFHAIAVGGALAAGLVPATALAATFPTAVQDADAARQVDDFLHYVLIAKPDLAEAAGRSLFDSGISDAELAEIVRENDLGGKVERALSRGRGMAGVGPMVMRFESSLEQGRLDLARDQDRIREAIEMLDGPLRGQLMARNRLVEAGEYAVPQLLQTLITTRDPQMELRVTEVLGEIKRQAVLPLCAALPDLSADVQVKVCRILAGIGWPTALPFLLDVGTGRDTSPEVREAAMNAFRRLGGTSTDVSAAYTALARKFFEQEQSLVAYPGDPENMVWNYGVHGGLSPVPVPTSIFSQVMAMRCGRAALDADPSNRMALATFVAADLRRENQLGADQVDPFAADASYSPQFFATASGSSICRDVLSMAIDSTDTALVRDAVAAIGETVGQQRLFAGGRAPLLECLRYPDRRVRYDAALVLGNAMPSESFPGDSQIVPLLASAVRSGADNYAAVVAPTEEDRNRVGGLLQAAGFRVIAAGGDFYELEPELTASNGVDLVIVQGGNADAIAAVSRIRDFEVTGATPVMVVSDIVERIALDREFAQDRATVTWDGAGSGEQFESTLERLLDAASGGRLTEADAMIYTRDALQTLGVIARAGGSVFDIDAAESSLLEAMNSITGGMRLLVADVVSLIGTEAAQRALFDAALSAGGSEQVALLDATSVSARKFGNLAETRQIDALRRLIGQNAGSGGDQSVADAAGRLHGSLDLPADEAVRLITE